jgi:protein TonB
VAGAAAGLERALFASLALHGAVLAGVAAPNFPAGQSSVAREPIAARIVEVAPVEEKKRVSAPVKEAARRAPIAVENPVLPVERPIAPVAPVAIGEAVPPVIFPAPPGAVAADPGTIRSYRAQLLGEAGRFKRYPESARENNWAGDVAVAVAVGADGAPQVGLRRSSGHAVLDEQALDMFRQAARAVPLPPELRGREFRVEVRAVYGLED